MPYWIRIRDKAMSLVTNGMVHDLGIAGTPEVARNQLSDLAIKATIDQALLTIPE